MAKSEKNAPVSRQNSVALYVVLAIVIAVAALALSNPGFFPFLRAALNLTPAESATPYPTYTVLPSLTPRPTYTALPSHTPRPTYTLYPTFTATNTPTITPSPTPIPPSAVLARIQAEEKADLVVAEYEFIETDFHVGVDSGWRGWRSFGGDFVAQGAIEAGIDLTELNEDNIVFNADTESYTLLLPPPQLTTCNVKHIRLVKTDGNLLNPDFDHLRVLAEIQVMAGFIKRALERGIIDEAKQSAALILEDIARTFTGKQVATEYEMLRGKPRMGLTCQPSASGWLFNPDKKVWEKTD